MKRMSSMFGFLFFVLGFASGLGWFVSVPMLRYASVPSLLRSRLVDCERYENTYVFDESPRHRCYVQALVSMVKSYGIARTISSLRSYIHTANGNYLQGMRCHALAHEIGNVAARMGTPSEVLMNQCTGLCDFGQGREPVDDIDMGCLNGAGHTWVLMSSAIEEAFAKCAVPSIPLSLKQGCYHGIGHGLREKYGVDVQMAITQCLRMPNDQAQYQCAHAIFMESPIANAQIGLPADIPSYCKHLPNSVSESCYEFIGFMEYSREMNVAVALQLCDHAPDSTQSLCRLRVGEAIFTVRYMPNDIDQCVRAFSKSQIADCVRGFIRTSVDNVNDVLGESALRACQALPNDEQKECYRVLGEMLFLRFGDISRQQTCRSIHVEQYRQACLRATAL